MAPVNQTVGDRTRLMVHRFLTKRVIRQVDFFRKMNIIYKYGFQAFSSFL